VREGQVIRVAGMGEDGTGQGGSGDLYLRVRLAAHPDFRVRGADLYYTVDLAPWEAVLGTKVIVLTLQGRVVGANSTRHKQWQTIAPGAEHGLPSGQGGEHGDLYVVVNVRIPEQITEKERDIWKELSRISTFNPRTM